jgi:HD-GYP domain-containing protein (c-di-GMP phosphodiesterase class II)
MLDTQALLGKIAALRKQLEQARGLVEDAGSAAAALDAARSLRADPVQALQHKVALGAHHSALLEGALRQTPGALPPSEPGEARPAPLTARAARLVPRVRDLLNRLRELADAPLLSQGDKDPLADLHRETTLLAELAVRVLQTLPETPSVQLRLCEGVEGVLKTARSRADLIALTLEDRTREHERVETLAGLLHALANGTPPGLQPFEDLAEAILSEVSEAAPLRLLHAPASDPARFAACHSLSVARVVSRVVRHLPEWRGQPHRPVLAALVHDVGMLLVAPEVLSTPGPLDEVQRRAVEGHAAVGAELVSSLAGEATWLADAAASHHERLDGTGYPAGLSDLQIAPLVRLLAVCDVYAALCCPRPHRSALETRTALTDTLMLAQQGALDRDLAKTLLELSLYPVGAAVEMADGALGLVVATHQGQKDLTSCDRPVVALLTDGQGRPLPFPCHIDLAECAGRSIVRSLLPAERRQLLGGHHPEWA